MSNRLIFSWPEKNIEKNFRTLNFRRIFFSLTRGYALFSGEFDPPRQLTDRANIKLDKVHFSDISFTKGYLILKLKDDDVLIKYVRSGEPLKFKVIAPGITRILSNLNL